MRSSGGEAVTNSDCDPAHDDRSARRSVLLATHRSQEIRAPCKTFRPSERPSPTWDLLARSIPYSHAIPAADVDAASFMGWLLGRRATGWGAR